jgi:hypothetical protein
MHDRAVDETPVFLDQIWTRPAGLVVFQDRSVATTTTHNAQKRPWADESRVPKARTALVLDVVPPDVADIHASR